MKRFLYFIVILIVISACKEVFEAPPQALLQATFLNSSTKKAISPTVTVKGIGLDSLWVKDSVLPEIRLPLSATETTSYQISMDSYIDTVTFSHEKKQKYESMETGFYYEFELLTIESTHNRIDSIQITDSLVTKNWHENIKLYIRPLPATGN